MTIIIMLVLSTNLVNSNNPNNKKEKEMWYTLFQN